MATGHGALETSALPTWSVVARGFGTRLLYGCFGFLLVLLVRPGLMGQDLHLLVMTIGIYLGVCLAGGASDAIVGRGPKEPSLRRGTTKDVLALVLLVVVLIALWLGR